jgi:hypothetical protein
MGVAAFSIGVDLGQRVDHSAVAIAERITPAAPAFDPVTWSARQSESTGWVVRHLERIPLGTPYTAVAAHVVELARRPPLAGKCRLIVDATGVGTPVIDMLRASNPGCEVTAVWITGGSTERFDGSVLHVPKLELMARMQSLLEQNCLRIPHRLRESGTLVRELLDMRATWRKSGSLKVGADGAGQHDDLALAVALAVWPRPEATAGPQSRRLL